MLKILIYFKTNKKSLKCFKLGHGGKVGDTIGLFRKTQSSSSVKNELEESPSGCKEVSYEAVMLAGSLWGPNWHVR